MNSRLAKYGEYVEASQDMSVAMRLFKIARGNLEYAQSLFLADPATYRNAVSRSMDDYLRAYIALNANDFNRTYNRTCNVEYSLVEMNNAN